jgi:tungstate transport system substrate-binding protein
MLFVAACASERSMPVLEIATTTSVQNSGLLDVLLPAFPGAIARVHAVGSGRALEMIAARTVPLIISHAPDAEASHLRDHPDWRYQKIAYNQFIIVGRLDDPAKVRTAPDAAAAFRRIAASGALFVSRGDQSGTHEREQALWRVAGTRLSTSRYMVSGSSMSRALRHADERFAYTLTDEATFWQMEKQLSLTALFSGDPVLLNTYAVVHHPDHALATAFAEWVISGDGRTLIAQHRVEGRPAFLSWPRGCFGGLPQAQPCTSTLAGHK